MNAAESLFNRIKKEGLSAIKDMIEQRYSEDFFLDYKCVATGEPFNKLEKDDRENLGKALSGFGNSDGGVIIWGIEFKDDREKISIVPKPVKNVHEFKKLIDRETYNVAIPANDKVECIPIESGKGNEGYLVLHIPLAVKIPILKRTSRGSKYYIRAGTVFGDAPHTVIEGLFGRRPLPNLKMVFTGLTNGLSLGGDDVLVLPISVSIKNVGSVIAYDTFMVFNFKSIPGGKCVPSFPGFSENTNKHGRPDWITQRTYRINDLEGVFSSAHLSINTTEKSSKLAPDAFIAVVANLSMKPPFENDLVIEGVFGSKDSVPIRFRISCSKSDLANFYLKKHEELLQIKGHKTNFSTSDSKELLELEIY